LAGKTSWPVDNIPKAKPGHFIVLVCFLDKIGDPSVVPEIYVVPSVELELQPTLIYRAPGGRKTIELRTMRKEGSRFRDAWKLLV